MRNLQGNKQTFSEKLKRSNPPFVPDCDIPSTFDSEKLLVLKRSINKYFKSQNDCNGHISTSIFDYYTVVWNISRVVIEEFRQLLVPGAN